ncbi:MAG: bis(5'-nucleosyl)-tetraphosphatase (symmetrical) YqeK [Oscillospiraceae bacterium]|nr:bis(5'-nucleosyl)-tetraphosphatase (symmetrical) YqeK [Oscillospiraceae bacterium]
MYEEIIKQLSDRLSEKRYIHSLNVAKKAKELAELYGADLEKAYLSGLLHDIMKETSPEKQLKLISEGGIIVSRDQMMSPKLWHAYSSAVYLRDYLKIEDEEIFDAVFYHTTGKPDMPTLTKIIYLADMISEDRDYKELPYLKELSYKNLDEAVTAALEMSIDFLKEKGSYVCEKTTEALEFMKKGKKDL